MLMLLGVLTMFFGSGATLIPLSTVKVAQIEISEISPFSATLIGIGAIIFLVGIGLYLKGK